jgi:hypothetical protein
VGIGSSVPTQFPVSEGKALSGIGKLMGLSITSCKRDAKTLYATPDNINNMIANPQTKNVVTLLVFVYIELNSLGRLAIYSEAIASAKERNPKGVFQNLKKTPFN